MLNSKLKFITNVPAVAERFTIHFLQFTFYPNRSIIFKIIK